MKRFTFCILAVLAGLCFAHSLFSNLITASTNTTFLQREDAYRENNIGVALLEQFEPAKAVEAFRRALKIDPELKIAQTNLAIALFNAQEIDAARAQAENALKADPNRLQLHYLLGLIAKNQNRTEDAVESFQRVLNSDPKDVGANVNLGQILMQQRKFPEAAVIFRRATLSEPYNSTAVYNLATALLRGEHQAEGQALIDQFQTLRQSGAATSIGQNYLEQGRYAEAITSTGAEPELVNTTRPNVSFRIENIGLTGNFPAGRNPIKALGSGTTLFDFDNDGDLDVAVYNARLRRIDLYRNQNGKLTSVTLTAGNTRIGPGISVVGIVAGDYNNDKFDDLLVFGRGQVSLFANDGKGKFKNVSVDAKLPKSDLAIFTAAFADSDHDGDLDILLGGSSQEGLNVLLRNNGDGTFVDVTTRAKVNIPIGAKAIIPTDYDNRRDIDLLILNFDGRPALFRNNRDGSFTDVSTETGLDLAGKWTSAAAADVNKDSYTDFFFGREDGVGVFALSDGRGKFKLSDAPKSTQRARSAQFLDYDNDGLVDLIVATTSGVSIVRNIGSGWTEIEAAVPRDSTIENSAQSILSGDVDGDGDIDLIISLSDGTARFLRNVGGELNNAEIVRLKGLVSNRSGLGSKIDLRSGSLFQKAESFSASPMPAPSQIHFGLGRRISPDVIRVIWPSGVVQAEIEPKRSKAAKLFKTIEVQELDRKPSSCPYLYTWNGERFEFITDFLGGGEMGNWQSQGSYHFPDSDEYVRIPSDKLVAKGGTYELRVTNELEEVLFLDHLKLIAVEHDRDVEVYPNEGLGIPTGKRILYTVRDPKPPKSAIDGAGNDVRERIVSLDHKFYDSFKTTSIRGYSESHSLTLDLDERKGFNGRTILLLTGWTDYAFSSDNLAASQSGKSLFFPKLQVKDRSDNWRTVVDSIGISVGRPQTVVVDLTGKFLSSSREVRIVTNVKTYWDKIAVDTSEQQPISTTDLIPARAELRERGFSRARTFEGMIVPTYGQVVNDGRWKNFSGWFTRIGDVRRLLEGTDDVFVISKTGDELILSFTALPEPPVGKVRTFLLYADGYSKEMDINSGSPEAVFPLPFKGMTRYPYGDDERFPMTPEKRRFYDEYTTRRAARALPSIESSLLW